MRQGRIRYDIEKSKETRSHGVSWFHSSNVEIVENKMKKKN